MKNSTKFSCFIIWLMATFASFDVCGQALYDDWPVTVSTNRREETKNNGASTNFVTFGRSWDRRILTYAFQNGTDDINGNDERLAIRQGFDIWAARTDLEFLEVCDPNNADIVFLWGQGAHGDPIAGGDFDGRYDGVNANVLAHQLGGPAPGANPALGNQAGDIHFDDAEDWVNQDRGGSKSQPIDLVTVAAHEIGHALGLDHTTVGGSLMLSSYNGSHRFLGSDDAAGIQSIYGIHNNNLVRSPNIDINTQPICGSVVLVVDNVPNGATLIWTSSNPNGLEIVNDIATRKNGFNGQVIVTATINSGCGNLSISRSTWVGSPNLTKTINGNTNSTVPVSAGYGYSLQASSLSPNTSFNYNDSSGYGDISITIYNPNDANTGMYVSGNSTFGNRHVDVTATNGCGSYSEDFVFYLFSGYRVASNPAKDNVTVIFNDASYQDALSDQIDLLSEKSTVPVRTVNVQETASRSAFKNGNAIEFNVADLPRGTYYLHIKNSRREDQKVDIIRLLLE